MGVCLRRRRARFSFRSLNAGRSSGSSFQHDHTRSYKVEIQKLNIVLATLLMHVNELLLLSHTFNFFGMSWILNSCLRPIPIR